MLEFSRPIWLLLLLAIPAIYWLGIRMSYASLGPWQRWISLALRVIIWLLLVSSLAGAQFVRRSDRVSVMVVRDSSDSIDDSQLAAIDAELAKALGTMKKDDSLGKVNFGADAYIELLPKPGVDERLLQSWNTEPRGNFTNISEAMQLAVASFPDNAQKRLVLITDGNENVGSALAEARVARDNGVELIPVELPSRGGPEVVLESLEAPAQASLGEKVNVRFVLNSTVETAANVSVMRNGEFVGRTSVNVRKGKEVYEFPVEVDQSGFFTFEVAVEPKSDTIAANNRAYTFSVVEGRPRLLYASGDPGELAFLPRTLQAHNVQVDVVDPGGIPYSLEDFQVYDGIIFSDVAAFDITPEQMKMVQVLVRDFGRGFMMLGGERSFGPGGYFETPIEETLPVDMDFRKKKITPSTLVVCLVDKSGSMAETVGGTEKIHMAREACKEVVKLQTPRDYVGVMGFDSTPQWVVEPVQGIDKEATLKTLSQMEAGGGTDLYPALENAYNAAKQIPAQIKHFLIFTDGMVAPGPFEELTAKMKADKCTISTVAFGTDADIPFMTELAKAGGGNMYEARNIHDLPRIFTREVFLANKATLNEDPFKVKVGGDSVLTSSIGWGGAPLLYGYVATSAKDRAQVPLLTQKDDPLLATWRYGLGKSAAFTSDAKNRWGRDWLDWSGYERFFTGLARWIRSDLSSGNLTVATSLVGREGVVSVTAVDSQGGYLDNAQLEARLTDPELKSRSVPLRQVGPGEYEGRFEIGDNGNYFVNVVQMAEDVGADPVSARADRAGTGPAPTQEAIPVAAQAGGLAVSYSPEYRELQPNRYLLAQIKEGSIVPSEVTLAGLFTEQRKPARRLEDAWELFTLLALLLWLFDVAARRIVMDAQDMRLAMATLLAGPGGRRAARTVEQLSGLRSAKERASRRMPGVSRVGAGTEHARKDAVEAAASRPSEASIGDLRSRLDAGAAAQQRAGVKPEPTATPEGQINAPPKQKPALQNATDISELRKRIAADRTKGSVSGVGASPIGKPGAGAGPAPAQPEKPKVELTDREVTSRLLERKRKQRDE